MAFYRTIQLNFSQLFTLLFQLLFGKNQQKPVSAKKLQIGFCRNLPILAIVLWTTCGFYYC